MAYVAFFLRGKMADAEIDIQMQQLASTGYEPSLWLIVVVACIFLIYLINYSQNSGHH